MDHPPFSHTKTSVRLGEIQTSPFNSNHYNKSLIFWKIFTQNLRTINNSSTHSSNKFKGIIMHSLYDIVDELNQFISVAEGFRWDASEILVELEDFANRLKEQADEMLEKMAQEHGQ
jgi:hypothetical protein